MTLFEIIISSFIFSLILFAFEATQIKIQCANLSLYYQAMALQQLAVATERLRVADFNLSELVASWNDINKKILPKGQGKIIETHTAYVAKIRWGPASSFNKCPHTFQAHLNCLQLKIPKKIANEF